MENNDNKKALDPEIDSFTSKLNRYSEPSNLLARYYELSQLLAKYNQSSSKKPTDGKHEKRVSQMPSFFQIFLGFPFEK